jgi:Fe-S oxidoreductase
MNPITSLGAAGYILFWGLTAIAAGIFFFRSYQLLKLLSLGRKAKSPGNIVWQTIKAIGHLIVQECQFKNIRKKDRAGIGHLFMVWGFLLFVTYYLFFIVISYGFGLTEHMEGNAVYTIYCWIMDIAAPFVFLGALWGILRRYITKPKRLEGQQTWEALFILITVLLHPITHVGKIATQIAVGEPPVWGNLPAPPLSNAIANLWANSGSVAGWHTMWFWAHWGFVLLVLGIIGYTRYLHVPAAIINDMVRAPKKGELERIDIKDPKTFGTGRVDNFTQKQLLDTYACVVCGYCQDVCPATNTSKPLNPRLVIRDIKKNLMTNGPLIQKNKELKLPLIGDAGEGSVSEGSIWSCTTCWACMEVCPVYIEHVPKIIDMRRQLVQMQSKFPEELLNLFENIEGRSNPWGIAPSDRVKWAQGLNIKPFKGGETEYLLYVGCFGSFDARSRHISVSLAKILDAAGVSWGILGKEELCCGDSLRKLGNEYAYDKLAQANVAMFKNKGVTKIITECPHCFTTLKNDYTQYGLKLEVYHHTEIIDKLIKEGRLKLDKTDLGKTVFHDSCYLSRHNGIYEPPRDAISAATGKQVVEMDKNHNRGFCCGAGGGRMWMEENLGTRINHDRVKQAMEKDPNSIAVCCPYCLTMFEDGVKDAGKDVKVLDVAEIVAKSLPAKK